jgi:hypothetical protein
VRALGIAVLCLAPLGCMAQQSAGGAVGTGGVARPGAAPAPTSNDPTMPTSLPPPPSAAAAMPQNSTWKAGYNLTVAGAGLGVAGVTFVVLGMVLPCKTGDPGCDADVARREGNLFTNLGIAGVVIGAVGLAVGIPLMVVGSNQARAEMSGGVSLGPKGLRVVF